MQLIFIGIVAFLCMLAVFDLLVGVSNDAVNFVNSAIGAKAASFKTIVAIAAVGVFAGAAMSNGMMDVARHGIFTPQYYSFFEVMCIFLAVMVTDVVLLDVFNSLGMPTSTTVSMVFELLGGAFALALVKIANGQMMADGTLLGLGDLLNTDKALSVILAIFLSVAVAFVFGTVVMWLSRLIFSFAKPKNNSLKTIIFGAFSATAIIWFLLINGLKGSSFMTPEVKGFISDHTWVILASCFGMMTMISGILAVARINILKVVVMMGTFALAMAFAGNDLVNFVGVPLTGLDAFLSWRDAGYSDANTFMMNSLQQPAQTPVIFLLLAGGVMVLSLIFSKKAQNVVKTSVDLSRQDEGDEMFGSSGLARTIVCASTRVATGVVRIVPRPVGRWIDSRFNTTEAELADGAAFDLVRASVNLVLAGLLVALGTTNKLPLSTTYVTFMVAMGASLADRAWGRESAVFRITGVLSVIGGWFITAGVAFFLCFLVAGAMYFCKFPVMILAIVAALFLLIRSHRKYNEQTKEEDHLFKEMLATNDKTILWQLLCEHIRLGNAARLKFVISTYSASTDSFLNEHYKTLKHGTATIDNERKALKRQRRREIVAMNRLDPLIVIQHNTWYFLSINSCNQMLYSLKRINDPIREHVGNNFLPMPEEYQTRFIEMRDNVLNLYKQTLIMLQTGDFTHAERIRENSTVIQEQISADRKKVLDGIQTNQGNLNTQLLTVHILQESQELISALRHMIRGMNKFAGSEE